MCPLHGEFIGENNTPAEAVSAIASALWKNKTLLVLDLSIRLR